MCVGGLGVAGAKDTGLFVFGLVVVEKCNQFSFSSSSRLLSFDDLNRVFSCKPLLVGTKGGAWRPLPLQKIGSIGLSVDDRSTTVNSLSRVNSEAISSLVDAILPYSFVKQMMDLFCVCVSSTECVPRLIKGSWTGVGTCRPKNILPLFIYI